MGFTTEVREAFPELDEIDDADLRERTVAVWVDALEASEFDSLAGIPWVPGFVPVVGPDEDQIGHIRQVTAGCLAMAETLTSMRPGLEVDRDLLVAGALLHDISKLYEISAAAAEGAADGYTELNAYLPHPHYSVHQLAEADFSLEMLNLVLAHTEMSKVEPQSIEAKIVESVDLLVTDATFWEKAGRFKPDPDDPENRAMFYSEADA